MDKVAVKWQKIFAQKNLFVNKFAQNKKKINITPMFPYPSGEIHLGHMLNYTIGDVQAYKKRLEGYNVLHSIGWDAFGLPAENAAIKHGIHPMTWTLSNIDKMNEVLKYFSFDMSHQAITCDKEYYQITQKIFLILFDEGLAYQKDSIVNWDPVDQTVLANEQVVDGKGWRSGAKVEKKKLKQWHLRITKYNDTLLNNIDKLNDWPDKIRQMQRNWIGKQDGVMLQCEVVRDNVGNGVKDSVDHRVKDSSSDVVKDSVDHRVKDSSSDVVKDSSSHRVVANLNVFHNAPETLFNANFLAIDKSHKILLELNLSDDLRVKIKSLQEFNITKLKDTIDGVFVGYYVVNRVSGAQLPIYIVNYLDEVYDNCCFSAPSVNKLDRVFSEKYNIDYVEIYDEKKNLINSGFLSVANDVGSVNTEGVNTEGLNIKNLNEKAIKYILNNKLGEKKRIYNLKDWGISRQRYWGCPIPIIHCEKCGPQANNDLPVELPRNIDLTKSFPLKNHPNWKVAKCPKCGGVAEKETDTLDTFMCSSWYYLKYCSDALNENDINADNDVDGDNTSDAVDNNKALSKSIHINQMLNLNNIKHWMGVDIYIGGAEHAILHLLYARFINHVLFEKGISSVEEPFGKLFTQGMLLHEVYKDSQGEYIEPYNVYKKNDGLFSKLDDKSVTTHGIEKMSKSKKNVITIDAIEQYGLDAIRLFLMSDAPLTKDIIWSDERIKGVQNFLKKLAVRAGNLERFDKEDKSGAGNKNDIGNKNSTKQKNSDVEEYVAVGRIKVRKSCMKLLHKIIKLSSLAIDEIMYNKAVAYVRELYNFETLNKYEEVLVMYYILIILFPFIPFTTSEIYENSYDSYKVYRADLGLSNKEFLYEYDWPKHDEKYIGEDQVNITVQVNGKKKAVYMVNVGENLNAHVDNVKKLPNVKNALVLTGKSIRKVICIPNKIINFVV